MSTSIKTLLALGLFTIVAACSQQEEAVVVEEPVFEEAPTTKF